MIPVAAMRGMQRTERRISLMEYSGSDCRQHPKLLKGKEFPTRPAIRLKKLRKNCNTHQGVDRATGLHFVLSRGPALRTEPGAGISY